MDLDAGKLDVSLDLQSGYVVWVRAVSKLAELHIVDKYLKTHYKI